MVRQHVAVGAGAPVCAKAAQTAIEEHPGASCDGIARFAAAIGSLQGREAVCPRRRMCAIGLQRERAGQAQTTHDDCHVPLYLCPGGDTASARAVPNLFVSTLSKLAMSAASGKAIAQRRVLWPVHAASPAAC